MAPKKAYLLGPARSGADEGVFSQTAISGLKINLIFQKYPHIEVRVRSSSKKVRPKTVIFHGREREKKNPHPERETRDTLPQHY